MIEMRFKRRRRSKRKHRREFGESIVMAAAKVTTQEDAVEEDMAEKDTVEEDTAEDDTAEDDTAEDDTALDSESVKKCKDDGMTTVLIPENTNIENSSK